MSTNLAPHEILNIQELLNANILESKMIGSTISMIKDEELKQIMQEHLESKKTKLKEIEDFINNQMNNQSNAQNNNNNQNQNNNNQNDNNQNNQNQNNNNNNQNQNNNNQNNTNS